MDFKKIFIEDAQPTKIGGQAVLEGIMMKGEDRSAVAVRLPDDSLYIKTEKLKQRGAWVKIPIVRGVAIFIDSLVTGMRTLMFSAEILAEYDEEDDADTEAAGSEANVKIGTLPDNAGNPEAAENESADGAPKPANDATAAREKPGAADDKSKSNPSMTFTLILSVVIAIVFVVGIFIIAPTWIVNLFGAWIENDILLNLIEGVLRILLFVLYIALISKMKDIRTVFSFHGAEHKCIHCYESGLELTPDNCQSFETLHPRCGTSFLMFVMVIALLLFSLLGWPNLLIRIASRIVLVPVIAGLSYELLRWAGQSTSGIVKVLSVPGLLLQRLTTLRPDEAQLEVAIAAMKAVLVPADTPVIEGRCDLNGELIVSAPESENPIAEAEFENAESLII